MIFVVDDHDDSREMMQQLFEMNGFAVASCADGCQAMEEALRLKPDVVVVDGRLPGQDGWALTRQLRAMGGAIAETRIVFVSAAADAGSEAAAYRSGCSCYLTKPVDLARLMEAVTGLAADARTLATD